MARTLYSEIWYRTPTLKNFQTPIFFPSPNLTFGRTPPPPKFPTPIFFPESKSDLWQNTPPKFPNSNFLPQVQIRPLAEHPPPNFQAPIFFPESKSNLWQNIPLNFQTPIFFPESKSDPWQNSPWWWLQYVETNRCIPQGYHLVFTVQEHCAARPVRSFVLRYIWYDRSFWLQDQQ